MVTTARHVLLDSGPLSLACKRRRTKETDSLVRWISRMLQRGADLYVPEIADFEVRRELLRAGKKRSIELLDSLHHRLNYLPLTTDSMKLAASFWAETRKGGKPTESDDALAADAILAAQAVILQRPLTVIATTNLAHLQRFVAADLWTNIEAA